LKLETEAKVEKQWLFDNDFTRRYTKVRQEFIARFLGPVQRQIDLESALDVGAGVGYFASFLRDFGLKVSAVDAREENVAEGRRRHPDIEFVCRDVEDESFVEIGRFDLVLCVGLLYHLENPFRAIRNLHTLTRKILIVESMCVPGMFPNLELLDEGKVEDQGLNFVGFYPTEACLVKMLYRAGFPAVYRFRQLPDDEQFINTARRKRLRTFLIAAKVQLDHPNLLLVSEPSRRVLSESDPWTTPWSRVADYWASQLIAAKTALRRFFKPSRGKAGSLSK
jgi:SAM-dependent methyltransferase